MEIIYRLNNPNYTIYHRAALGGLAATIKAWSKRKITPEGISATLQRNQVTLSWGDELPAQDALRRILDASFRLTKDKLIDLPGQGVDADDYSLRLAIHNGICGTFLDHTTTHKKDGIYKIELKNIDDLTGGFFSYKALRSYAHQDADERLGLSDKKGTLEKIADIPKWVIPGAYSGATHLETNAADAFLLLYLMVGSTIFLLRPRMWKEKAQFCVVVPNVDDLQAFAARLQIINARTQNFERFTNNYLGRVVGGAEDAALRFLIDIGTTGIAEARGIDGCLSIAMGKASWGGKNQNYRSQIIKLKDSYPDIGIYRAAYSTGKSRFIKPNKNSEGFAAPGSPLPELIAANLAREAHWCGDFRTLVSKKEEFKQILFHQGGLQAMNQAVKEENDKAIISAFHEAWKMTMKNLYDRAREENLKSAERLIDVRRERIRNDILRAKTSDALAGWFLQFCANSTKEGGKLKTMQAESERIRKFIFNPRNFDQFQNLCLFALVSYASEPKSSQTENNQPTGGEN
ncbi:MAG: type I-MYXAN CRISPR-associated Cas8a1/Cmx1 [Blastocatellia bacterium]|nr:type I-MYXAN CRISPR-associated Cas8a1/Cmx1 [Blastocatellia bacterium]